MRALSQSGLNPANCRLLDPREAAITGAARGEKALLVLGFESADHPLEPWMERALDCCGDHGGEPRRGPTPRSARDGPWRGRARRGRGRLAQRVPPGALPARHVVAAGVLSETFETAMTWDRFGEFVADGDGGAGAQAPRSHARGRGHA